MRPETFVLLIIAAAVAGCAMPERVYAPDGQAAYRLSCDGAKRSWEDCAGQAGDLCRERGYVVLSRTDRLPVPAYDDLETAESQPRRMVVACAG